MLQARERAMPEEDKGKAEKQDIMAASAKLLHDSCDCVWRGSPDWVSRICIHQSK